MAICRKCHKTIPDGMIFCTDCENTLQNQADESYLDSLLSSVSADFSAKMTPKTSESSDIEPKIRKINVSEPQISEPDIPEVQILESDIFVSEEAIPVESIPIESIPEESIPVEDSPEIYIEDIVSQTSAGIIDDVSSISSDEAIIDDSEIINDSDAIVDSEINIDNVPAENELFSDISDSSSDTVSFEEVTAENEDLNTLDFMDSDLTMNDDIISDIDAVSEADIISDTDTGSEPDINFEDTFTHDIESDFTIEEDIVPQTDITSDDISVPDFEPEINVEDSIAAEEAINDKDDIIPEDVDMLLDSLLADMDAAGSFDQPAQEEMLAADDLSDIFSAAEEEHTSVEENLSVEENFTVPEELTIIEDPISEGIELEAPSDDMFSEAPPEIEVPVIDNISIENSIDFLSEEDLEKSNSEIDLLPIGDFNIDSVLNDIDSGDLDNQLDTLDEEKSKKKIKKTKKDSSKKSFWQKIFGNVVEELTPEQIEAEKQKAIAAEEKKKADAELRAKRAQESKEEKAARKAEEKIAKEEAAKKKAEEKKKKAEEAKEKARQKKEAKLALEELDVNEGRINRIGSTILFIIFAVLTIFIIVGSNIYSYNLSIRNAQKEFDIHHYNDAYYEVYGLDIHDEDIELYDQIMTVMYVNTQLNAYEYYMTSNNKDKALDSLLRGLQRYDKYLELATKLDIEDDLNYVKNNILAELDSSFKLSETEAYNMIALRDDVDYSEYIYSLLGEYEVDFSGKNSSY